MNDDRGTIQVSCLSVLSRYQPEGGELEITRGDTPAEVVDRLGIPRKEVNLVLVNRERADWDASLAPGDRLGLAPLMNGG